MQKLLFVILLIMNFTCYSQDKTGGVRSEMISFLDSKGEFGSVKADEDLIYGVDVIRMEMVDKNSIGVFRIGVTASHAKTYFMLKTNKETLFLNMEKVEIEILALIDFLSDLEVYEEKDKLSVVKSYVETIRKNQEVVPWE